MSIRGLPTATPATSSASPSAARRVSELINSFWAAQVINVAARLQIPDQLAHGPKTADELARASEAHAPSVLRLMRALQTLGLSNATDNGMFELTEAGHLLRANVPGSVRGRALFTGDMLWKQFGDLTYVVKTGNKTQAIVSGAEGFAKLQEDPARLDAFQQTMAEGSVRAAHGAMKVYNFGQFRSVLDLGGGYGGVLSVLLASYPQMTGAVCDLAYLSRGATAYLEKAGVSHRSAFLPGDFFESVPEGFDAYVMKYIIHDWDDEHALLILENCRKSAAASSKVILLEQVIPDRLGEDAADQAVIRADLTMMTIGGKERTAEEYRDLFSRAGWKLTSITAASDGISVLEAVPV